jgi:peptidoglycan/LPS O-acetylase OafA/YrhL
VAGQADGLTKILSSKPLVYLGGLSFPIFIVHGPIGQVFYKKLIAKKLWGGVLFGPEYFLLYCAVVLGSAFLLNKLVLESPTVTKWSQRRVEQFSSWM